MTVRLTEQFELIGDELDLQQAEAIKQQGQRLIELGVGPAQVNLAALARANSLTVAVLMAWYRHAMRMGTSITFASMSQELINIIEFSGLHELLLDDGAASPQRTGAVAAEGL